MKIIKKGDYQGVTLESVQRLDKCYVAIFNTHERYVDDVYSGNNVVVFNQDSSCTTFEFQGVDCDYCLVAPLKHQYAVYFLEDLWEDGDEVLFDLDEVVNE